MNEHKGRVLIVEDDEDICALLKYAFTEDGYTVSCAADGDSAMRFLREHKPRLVLLDIMLPGADGLEILRHIRREPELKNTAVIMLTAKGEHIDKILGLEYGADDYMTKPFNILEVKARIKTIMRRASGSQPNYNGFRNDSYPPYPFPTEVPHGSPSACRAVRNRPGRRGRVRRRRQEERPAEEEGTRCHR